MLSSFSVIFELMVDDRKNYRSHIRCDTWKGILNYYLVSMWLASRPTLSILCNSTKCRRCVSECYFWDIAKDACACCEWVQCVCSKDDVVYTLHDKNLIWTRICMAGKIGYRTYYYTHAPSSSHLPNTTASKYNSPDAGFRNFVCPAGPSA